MMLLLFQVLELLEVQCLYEGVELVDGLVKSVVNESVGEEN